MVSDKRSRLKEWLDSGEAKLCPATFPQRELWEASPVAPGDVSNHICTVTTIKGVVSRGDCEKAVTMVVARQEAMRLSILPGKNGPVQLVRKSRKPVLGFRELGDTEKGEADIAGVIDEIIQRPFDLVAGPLYRIEVVRVEPEEHMLILVIHHAIADGWTLGVFMTDLWSAYALLVLGLPGGLDPVPQSYTDWGAAQRAFWTPQMIRARRLFWQERMEGAERMFEAPEITAENAGVRRRWEAEVPGEIFSRVRALAGAHGATLFSAALAAFQIMLAGATGKTDVLVGSPVADRGKKNVWDTMGSFAGIVPLRGSVHAEKTVAEQIAETHQMTIDCFANALPFVELVNALEVPVVPGKNPVFDVRFALQNHPVPDISMPGMEVEYRTRSTGTSRFDLACELTEIGANMEVVWLYREDVFSDAEVEEFHRAFFETLNAFCEDSSTKLEDLNREIEN